MDNKLYEKLLVMLMSDEQEMCDLAFSILVQLHDKDPYLVTSLKNVMVSVQRFWIASVLRDIERGTHKLQGNEIR